MPNIRHWHLAGFLCAGLTVSASANATQISLSGWTPQFVGVSEAEATFSSSVAYIEQINLTAPGIGFTVTPQSGPLETTGQTTSQFLLSSGTQVAINANFFAPCCNAAAEPKTLVGLSVSDGTVVSGPDFGNADAAASLLISASNRASIVPPAASGPLNLTNVFNAVSGNLIVEHGANVSSVTPTGAPHDPFGLDPRSAVGLSQDGEYLYLVAVDGRQPGYSVGVTTSDLADLLIDLGAYEGLNLDGGGSTELVEAGGAGRETIINSPSGGTGRYDGNNIGVFAEPLPEPTSLLPFVAGLGSLLVRIVRQSRR